MKRNKKVRFILTVNYDGEDTFPTEWDEEQIKEYIKKHFEEYIEEPEEVEGIYIYEEATEDVEWEKVSLQYDAWKCGDYDEN